MILRELGSSWTNPASKPVGTASSLSFSRSRRRPSPRLAFAARYAAPHIAEIGRQGVSVESRVPVRVAIQLSAEPVYGVDLRLMVVRKDPKVLAEIGDLPGFRLEGVVGRAVAPEACRLASPDRVNGIAEPDHLTQGPCGGKRSGHGHP